MRLRIFLLQADIRDLAVAFVGLTGAVAIERVPHWGLRGGRKEQGQSRSYGSMYS